MPSTMWLTFRSPTMTLSMVAEGKSDARSRADQPQITVGSRPDQGGVVGGGHWGIADVNVPLWGHYVALTALSSPLSRSRAVTGWGSRMRSLSTSGAAGSRSPRSASAAASGSRSWPRASPRPVRTRSRPQRGPIPMTASPSRANRPGRASRPPGDSGPGSASISRFAPGTGPTCQAPASSGARCGTRRSGWAGAARRSSGARASQRAGGSPAVQSLRHGGRMGLACEPS